MFFLILSGLIVGLRTDLVFADDTLTVEIYEDYDFIEVLAYSEDETSLVMDIQYSLDDGATWISSPAENGTSYGETLAVTYIESCDLPPGTHDLLIKAIGNEGGEYPLGYYEVNYFDGSYDDIAFYVEEREFDELVYFEIYSEYDCEPLNISSVEYRFNGGSWTEPTETYGDGTEVYGLGSDFINGYLYADIIPEGFTTVEFRAFDEKFGLEWPLDQNYSEYIVTIGTYAGPTVDIGPQFYTEDFESGVGTEIITNEILTSTIGSEWSTLFTGNGRGRLRLQGNGFQQSGNGAGTIDSPYGIPATADFTLTQDMRPYEGSEDIALVFSFMWHDNQDPTGQENKVYFRETSTSTWKEAYNLQTNGELGVYKEVQIDLDSLQVDAFGPDAQIRFHYEGSWSADTLTMYEGFSLDDLSLHGTQTTIVDTTPPEINFTEEPQDIISPYSIPISGTAVEDASDITSITGSCTVSGDNNGIVDATPIDGAFDSILEEFDLELTCLGNGEENYVIEVTVTNSEGGYQIYTFTGMTKYPWGPMDFEVDNLGFSELTDSTPTYTGTVTDENGYNITNVEFWIYHDPPGGADHVFTWMLGEPEIDWTPATPTDGAFNSSTEAFTFTTPELIDGQKRVFVRATNEYGFVTSDYPVEHPGGGFLVDKIIIDAIDTSAPIVQIQDLIPNPTTDPTPKLQGKVRDNEIDRPSLLSQLWYRIDSGAWTELPALDGQVNEIEELFSIEMEGLSLGEHTVEVRATDISGNDTEVQGINDTMTFSIEQQDPNLTSTTILKTENFSAHNDQDIIGTEAIWGNSRLRLPEEFSPVRTPLVTDNYGDRYKRDWITANSAPSNAGGYWMSMSDRHIRYYDINTNTQTIFDLNDPVYGSELNADPITFEELYVNNEYHLWIATQSGLLGINFGTSITDGIGDSSVYYFPPGGYSLLLGVDSRTPNDYGIYISSEHNNGIYYYKPGNWGTTADDVLIQHSPTVDFNIGGATGMYFDQEEDKLWVGDYLNGLGMIDDNGTPTNTGDDQKLFYEYGPQFQTRQIFAIGEDKDGKIWYGGDWGLFVIDDDNGTPLDVSDDTIIQLATPEQLNDDVISSIVYHGGEYPVGSQFFIGTRAGTVFYLSTNDTYTDPLDDQFITIDVTQGRYPAQMGSIHLFDYDTLYTTIERMGLYRIDLNRDFVGSASALSEIAAQVEGRLGVDFVTLNSVTFAPGFELTSNVNFEVSNDGGLTWYPITIGETISFPQTDYRIKFKINMTRGSTPVILGYNLSYAAYVEPDNRSLLLDVEDEPDTVYTNEIFSFDILALDELFNPFNEDQNLNVQLRKLSTNDVINDFNIQNVLIGENEGIAEINNARAAVLGLHYIYVTNGTESAVSDPINFIDQTSPTPTPTPTVQPDIALEITNHYVNQLEDKPTSAEICWTTNIDAVGYIDYGRDDDGITLITTSTDVTENYATNQCITLDALEPESLYTYTINATAKNSSEDSVTDTFSTGAEYVPTTTKECIILNDNSYKFTKDEITVSYQTAYPAICTLYYGHDENNLGNTYEDLILSEQHTGIINPAKLNGIDPLIIRIECNVADTISVQARLCSATDIVAPEEYNIEEEPKEPIEFTTKIIPIALTATSLLTVLMNLLAFPRFIIYALGWLRDRKKVKSWGIVYDPERKRPIPFATLRVYDTSNQLIKEKVTDIEGRYGFILDKGEYKLHINHPEYKKEIVSIEIEKPEEVAAYDIPLNSNKQFSEKSVKEKIIDNLRLINTVIIITGFTFSIIATIISPILINYLIITLYLIQFLILLLLKSRRGWGYVFDSLTRGRVDGAFVRLFDLKENKQVDVQMTDAKGRYGFKAEPGSYGITVQAGGYKFPADMQNRNNLLRTQAGIELLKAKVRKNKSLNLAIPIDKDKQSKTPFS